MKKSGLQGLHLEIIDIGLLRLNCTFEIGDLNSLYLYCTMITAFLAEKYIE